METNNTITEDEMLDNSFPLDDSNNFTPDKILSKEWAISDILDGYVPPENDSLAGKGWNYKSASLTKDGLNLGNLNAMQIDTWLPLDQFEDTCAFIDEALNNYKKLKEDNALLLEALKLYYNHLQNNNP